MMMKSLTIFLLFLSFFNASLAQEERPNILLILSDQHSGKITTQAGYQHVKTPGIDALAAQGVAFMRSYATYPVCVASRASIITGVMPSKSHDNGNLTNYESIGTAMKNAGYRTGYFGKWHVSNSKIGKVADWHGFETYKDLRNDSEVETISAKFLENQSAKPFFMITSFLNPHDCCELARNIAGFTDKYHDGPVVENIDVNYAPPIPFNFAVPNLEPQGVFIRRTPDSTNRIMFGKHPVKYWGHKEWRQYMYGYDRLVEKMDDHILNLVKKLEEENLLDNTIIFYTSDHGDGHGAHQWNQKMNFYEEVINVPFIISWKGHIKSGFIDKKTLVSSGLDLYPTICKLAGIAAPDYLPGVDLTSFIKKTEKNPVSVRGYVVSELNQTSQKPKQKFVGRMVVSEKFKYILFDDGENREQLFDLEKDPGELNPVTHKKNYKKQLLIHRGMLKEWIIKNGDSFTVNYIPK